MAVTGNPTRTRRIERAWLRDVNRRWFAFTRSVIPALKRANDAAMLANADPFVLSAAQQRTYIAFLEQEIDRLLLGTAEPPNWQARYQLDSYQRGLTVTRQQLISQGASIVPSEVERLAAQGLRPFTATPSLATAGGLQPVHQEALEFLFTRSYGTLKGWTDKLAVETRQILFDAVEQGRGIDEITRSIRDRIGVSKSRAQTIARTETNQAYSRAAVAETNRAAQETGEDIQVRWLTAIVPTARGNPVRHNHAKEHGVVMTTARAAGIKTDDGANCRCALAPVIPGSDTKAKQKRFAAERAEIVQRSLTMHGG